MKHWYESCVGEIYSTDEPKDIENLDCNICGDSDTYIGEFHTKEEAITELNEVWKHYE